jgi:flagellar protein FlaI
MFEAMHTGHSVYSTFHASNVDECIARLTNPPINLPRQLLASIGMIVVQHRNRRTGVRKTFQVAEMTPEGRPQLLMQYDLMQNAMKQTNSPNRILQLIRLYTGMSVKYAYDDIQEKVQVLRWLVNKEITNINTIGLIMSDYYTEKADLMGKVRSNSDYR